MEDIKQDRTKEIRTKEKNSSLGSGSCYMSQFVNT